MTTEQILAILYNNTWFTPANNKNVMKIKIGGIETDVPISYYHKMENNDYTILIRVSNHCTYLETWVRQSQMCLVHIINVQNLLK